jgi:hypothetical protein
MNSKTLSVIAILGIFALSCLFMSQLSVGLQIAFTAKGGNLGCGVDSKGDRASKGI